MTLVEQAGWVVRRLQGQHVHLLAAPDEVADTLLAVVPSLEES